VCDFSLATFVFRDEETFSFTAAASHDFHAEIYITTMRIAFLKLFKAAQLVDYR